MTSIAIDPILSNVVYTVNLLLHLHSPSRSPPYEKASNNLAEGSLPTVSVLVPVYCERAESIFAVAECLARQTYPKGRLEVFFILEPEDLETRRHVEEALKLLQGVGRIVLTDGGLKLKPHALNCGLKEAVGDVVCVYDADDRFDERQIEDAVNLMLEKGYDVVQPRISRVRKSVAGNFLMLDTYAWNKKFLPTFYHLAGVFPLSGEALFVRRQALEEVGGYPEVLTEDAYLAILLAEKGKKFGLLDSDVEELAPKGWRSHFRQRLRWFRGYITCCGRTLKAKMPLKKKLTLLIPFLAPVTCASSFITWAFLTVYWITWALMPSGGFLAPWMNHWMYTNVFFFWSAFLAYIGNPIIIFSLMHSLAGTKMERLAPLALLVPLYWMFIGVASIASFFKSTKYWGKTVR